MSLYIALWLGACYLSLIVALMWTDRITWPEAAVFLLGPLVIVWAIAYRYGWSPLTRCRSHGPNGQKCIGRKWHKGTHWTEHNQKGWKL